MSEDFYTGIDWAAPWYATVRCAGLAASAEPDWRAALNAQAAALRLTNVQGLPLHFIQQADLPVGVAYEAHIAATAGVPTRSNLHDFFNALVWLTFPHTKRCLNALQAAQIAELGIGRVRGPARDAATIFDENAALLLVTEGATGDALLAALRNHHWEEAFLLHRAEFTRHIQVRCFGHALMEKLVHPYKAITAHAWVKRVPMHFFAQTQTEQSADLDAALAQELAACTLTNAVYTPLPVLGIPDWSGAQDAAFYADRSVFRPKRIVKM